MWVVAGEEGEERSLLAALMMVAMPFVCEGGREGGRASGRDMSRNENGFARPTLPPPSLLCGEEIRGRTYLGCQVLVEVGRRQELLQKRQDKFLCCTLVSKRHK